MPSFTFSPRTRRTVAAPLQIRYKHCCFDKLINAGYFARYVLVGIEADSAMHGAVRIFVKLAIKTGWFRWSTIELTLAAGRKFRYQMQGYPFRVFATDWELDEICTRLIKDKYKYCEWDRAHPKTDAEAEIYDAVKQWMMSWVAKAIEVRAEIEAKTAGSADTAPNRPNS